LHPYLKDLKKKASFSKYILKNMKFLVNRFHVVKHLVQLACLLITHPVNIIPTCQNSVSLMDNYNTQCAEQSFASINKIRRRDMSNDSNHQCLHNLSCSFKYHSMYVSISLPAMSLGDWFSVSRKGGTGGGGLVYTPKG